MIVSNTTTLADYYSTTYRPDHMAHGRSDRVYANAINWLDQFVGAPATVDIPIETIAEFESWLLREHARSIPTARSYGRALRAMLEHAEHAQMIVADDLSTLGAFLRHYLQSRPEGKPSTRMQLELAADDLLNYFGRDKKLRAVTLECAAEFRSYLLATDKRKLATNTARRICGRAKQFFRAAERKRLVDENPFGDMKNLGVRGVPSRFHFVSREEAEKVLAVCPDSMWRLIFSLARFGGLRIPSELRGLRWADVDFKKGKMLVRSPKTEHIEGHETRIIPLFPELRREFVLFQKESAGDDELVFPESLLPITRHNLRQRMYKIVAKSGVTKWEKVFQNCRATRQTELCQEFPQHVVCEWLGNTRSVAQEHYLHTIESDFERAVKGSSHLSLSGLVNAVRGWLPVIGRKAAAV